jgi:hypothetical protein
LGKAAAMVKRHLYSGTKGRRGAWAISSGGIANFVNLAFGPLLTELRFGYFDGDGKLMFSHPL